MSEPLKAKVVATGVIRDKDGNIKHEIRFTGEGTPEEIRQIFTGVEHGSEPSDERS